MKKAALALLLAACGSSTAPSTPVVSAAVPTEAPAPGGRTVRAVRIEANGLEGLVTTDLTTAKKWAAEPANAVHVLPAFRHILVKAPAGNADARAAARRKADDLLQRLERGEDFSTLAKSSDDPGSAHKGGEYPGSMVKNFVVEIRRAYAELRPGERGRSPVESSYGWHVVAKGPIDDEARLEGHRAWLARSLAERIGHDLGTHLRHVEGAPAAAEIERAYGAALGADCSRFDALPAVLRMDAATCDGYASIARSGGMTWRDDVLVVATFTNDARDASEIEVNDCELDSTRMTGAELRALIERARQKH
jgi:hypothetical protein